MRVGYDIRTDVDRRIRRNEFPTKYDLMNEWELSERTVKRDIAYMRDRLGAPIEYSRSKKSITIVNHPGLCRQLLLKKGIYSR